MADNLFERLSSSLPSMMSEYSSPTDVGMGVGYSAVPKDTTNKEGSLSGRIRRQYKLAQLKAQLDERLKKPVSQEEATKIRRLIELEGTTPEELRSIKHYDTPTFTNTAEKAVSFMGSMMPEAGKISPMTPPGPTKIADFGQQALQGILNPSIRPRLDASREFAESQQPDIKPFVTGQQYIDPNIAQGAFDIGRKQGGEFAYDVLTHPLTYSGLIPKAAGVADAILAPVKTAKDVGYPMLRRAGMPGAIRAEGRRVLDVSEKKMTEAIQPAIKELQREYVGEGVGQTTKVFSPASREIVNDTKNIITTENGLFNHMNRVKNYFIEGLKERLAQNNYKAPLGGHRRAFRAYAEQMIDKYNLKYTVDELYDEAERFLTKSIDRLSAQSQKIKLHEQIPKKMLEQAKKGTLEAPTLSKPVIAKDLARKTLKSFIEGGDDFVVKANRRLGDVFDALEVLDVFSRKAHLATSPHKVAQAIGSISDWVQLIPGIPYKLRAPVYAASRFLRGGFKEMTGRPSVKQATKFAIGAKNRATSLNKWASEIETWGTGKPPIPEVGTPPPRLTDVKYTPAYMYEQTPMTTPLRRGQVHPLRRKMSQPEIQAEGQQANLEADQAYNEALRKILKYRGMIP